MKTQARYLLALFGLLLLFIPIYAALDGTVQAQDTATPENSPLITPIATNAPPTYEFQTPDEYRIVYLRAEEADEFASSIQEATLAIMAETWDDVLQADADEPIDAIIIGQDAVDLVDPVWLGDEYRDGLVYITINLLPIPRAELLNSECAMQEAEEVMSPEQIGTSVEEFMEMYDQMISAGMKHINITFRRILADDPDFQEDAEEIFFDTCGSNYDDVGKVYIAARDRVVMLSEDLTDTEREILYDDFGHTVKLILDEMSNINFSHQNPQMTPTVPVVDPTSDAGGN